MYKPCFVIPCYQHSATLAATLNRLLPHESKIFVVDDGSDTQHREQIHQICQMHSAVELIVHSENRGKGGAVSTGLKSAFAQGYTHAIQIDSDGQHDLSKISDLLSLSREHPNDIISGLPIYDDKVPKGRLYGRYITHVWVWIETLSLQIKDSMCGFRVYPLKPTVTLLKTKSVGMKMDFDIEILVRLYWQGLTVRYTPVAVTYPEDGLSHFDVVKDNVRISKMHTKLFFAMLPKFPRLLLRQNQNQSRSQSEQGSHEVANSHWHNTAEVGTKLGIKILLFLYKYAGGPALQVALYPVCFYYSLFGRPAKKASAQYRLLLQRYTHERLGHFSTFAHVHSFASAALDKFAVWFGDIRYEDLDADDVARLVSIASSGQGALFLSSHYGNIEVCRALGRFTAIKFNALVYYENAKKFNDLLSRVHPDTNCNLISTKGFGPDLAILLKDKVDRGEWVFMMGDRNSAQGHQRTLGVSLLGEEAQLPMGPFTMAYLLEVPIYVIHCYREGKRFRIRLCPMPPIEDRSRAQRTHSVQRVADLYAKELESVILEDPRQWYNFFNFWRIEA